MSSEHRASRVVFLSFFFSLLVTIGFLKSWQADRLHDAILSLREKPTGIISPSIVEQSGRYEKVERVIDGDTIELATGQKVRYIGINAPESDVTHSGQCYGKEAARKNKTLVEGQRVRLEKDISDIDKYGRLLRYVYIGNVFVNQVLVAEGYAHAVTYPPDVANAHIFQQQERRARDEKRGLWAACP